MTDSRKITGQSGNDGDVDPRFENFAAYVLNALDNAAERAAVESLIETDRAAEVEFNELTEATDLLAISVPQIGPPASLKARILEQAARETTPAINQRITAAAVQETRKTRWWSRTFQTGYVISTVGAMLVLTAATTLGMQNNRLSEEIDLLRSDLTTETAAVANLRSELSTTLSDSESSVAAMKGEMNEMESDFGETVAMVVHQEQMVSELAAVNTALQQALRDQSWMTYASTKEGYKVESWLADSRNPAIAAGASGLFAVRVVGNEAVFQVHGLEQPRVGFAYTLWLLGNGEPIAVSQFEVSEIGSATVTFSLPAPFLLYSSLVVTQERVDRIGTQPSEVEFLSADTN